MDLRKLFLDSFLVIVTDSASQLFGWKDPVAFKGTSTKKGVLYGTKGTVSYTISFIPGGKKFMGKTQFIKAIYVDSAGIKVQDNCNSKINTSINVLSTYVKENGTKAACAKIKVTTEFDCTTTDIDVQTYEVCGDGSYAGL